MFTPDRDQPAHMIIIQAVKDIASLAAIPDQPQASQYPQAVADSRFTQPELSGDFTNRQFTILQ
jgi:hypothetical protein